ncbi:unnamed protein product [Amoebophrya sp. A25]|nr:unnamed protein product [Amoebophrya sp. A25]|eukprot:GSA25T00019773001.1
MGCGGSKQRQAPPAEAATPTKDEQNKKTLLTSATPEQGGKTATETSGNAAPTGITSGDTEVKATTTAGTTATAAAVTAAGKDATTTGVELHQQDVLGLGEKKATSTPPSRRKPSTGDEGLEATKPVSAEGQLVVNSADLGEITINEGVEGEAIDVAKHYSISFPTSRFDPLETDFYTASFDDSAAARLQRSCGIFDDVNTTSPNHAANTANLVPLFKTEEKIAGKPVSSSPVLGLGTTVAPAEQFTIKTPADEEVAWGTHIWNFDFLKDAVSNVQFPWDDAKFGNEVSDEDRFHVSMPNAFGNFMDVATPISDQVFAGRKRIGDVKPLPQFVETSNFNTTLVGTPRVPFTSSKESKALSTESGGFTTSPSASGAAYNMNLFPTMHNTLVPPSSILAPIRGLSEAGSGEAKFLVPPVGLIDAVPASVERMNNTARNITEKSLAAASLSEDEQQLLRSTASGVVPLQLGGISFGGAADGTQSPRLQTSPLRADLLSSSRV